MVAGLIVLASARSSDRGAALDPGATGGTGAKGLDLLIHRLGGSVDTSGALPPSDRGVALVLADHLTTVARERVARWVGGGGTLVVADPSSDLAGVAHTRGPSPNSGIGVSEPLPPGCDAPWTQGVELVDTGGVALLARPPGATAACFGAGGGFFAIARSVGSGTIVSLAGPDAWTNHGLGHHANSVLAANLLVPRPGTTVAWLLGAGPGGGHRSLLALLPDRVDELLIGMLAAVVILVSHRARRLGRPVTEELPVVIPGSELVGAVSRLMARNDQREHAAELLRADARRSIMATMAAIPTHRSDLVAGAIGGRTGLDVAWVETTLYGPPPVDDSALVDLARALEHIGREVRGVRA